MTLERQAEIKLLADLINHPNRIFDTDALIRDGDFRHVGTRCIYAAIKRIAENDPSIERESKVDKDILEQKICTDFPKIYDKFKESFKKTIEEVYSEGPLEFRDFKLAVNFVLKNSIKSKAKEVLNSIGNDLDKHESYKELLSNIEQKIFDFTTTATDSSDIVVLGSNYEEFLAIREKQAKEGKLHIGISTGFPELDRAIGGGFRNGTINMFAARAKAGKSWFGLKIANNVAEQGIPVLYMDTELEENYQSDRRCSQHMGIPIQTMERAMWNKADGSAEKVQEFISYQKKHPIYYVDIKGWSIDRQISVIRKFYAKHVGKRADGNYNKGLVVLDYLKLMRAKEKGSDKEWEALGYRMTLLHDLMSQYNNPMLALAQQNRDGLEKEDESTISGSDRIIWLCDNFSIISAISEAELLSQQDDIDAAALGGSTEIPNTKLKVVVCRHGPGTPGGYIAYYFDIKDRRLSAHEVCGTIREDKRRISIQGTTKKGGVL